MKKEKVVRVSRAAKRRGAIAAGSVAMIIVIVILLNMIVGQLPENVTQLDISDQRIYEVADKALEYLDALDKDVEILFVITENAVVSMVGGGDAVEMADRFLQNYAAASDRVTYKRIDPVKQKSILETYDCEEYTVVVNCPETGKSRVIDLCGYTDYSEGIVMLDYIYGYAGYNYPDSFDANGMITSAVAAVTQETTGSVSFLIGHGESDMSSKALSMIKKTNVDVAESGLDLLVAGEIPDDCELIVCYLPTSDLADDELTMLRTFMSSGGNILLVIEESGLENFNELLRQYGMVMEEGIVGDKENYYKQYSNYYSYYCFAPLLSTANAISTVSGKAITIYPSGLTLTDIEDSNISVESFMTTSDSGILVDEEGNILKEDEKFILGAVGTQVLPGKEDGTDKTAQLIVFTSNALFDDSITQSFTSMSNLEILVNAVTGCFENITPTVSIAAKSITTTFNDIEGFESWGVVFVGVIPLGILITGFIVWLRRRKR